MSCICNTWATWAVLPKQVIFKAFAMLQVGQRTRISFILLPKKQCTGHLSSSDFSFQSLCYYIFVQNLHFVLNFLLLPMKVTVVSLFLLGSPRSLIMKYKKQTTSYPQNVPYCCFLCIFGINSFLEKWLLRSCIASFLCYWVPWISKLKLNSVCVQTQTT